jgi:guanine deaminase
LVTSLESLVRTKPWVFVGANLVFALAPVGTPNQSRANPKSRIVPGRGQARPYTNKHQMIYRATVMHTPENPFHTGRLEVVEDAGVLVRDGRIVALEDYAAVTRAHPLEETRDLRGGVLLPGFVDAHIHYPQVRVVGGLGMTLLDWLESNTLPEEARFADVAYARGVAEAFVRALLMHGTTSAMVFGAHFQGAQAAFFEEAEARGVRVVSGMVFSDRLLRPELHQTPAAALEAGRELIQRFHARGRSRYAVMPRFALSASEAMLEVCQQLLTETPDAHFHTHINENHREIQTVRELFPWAKDYLETYERFGLLGRRSVLAHNLHASDSELERLSGFGSSVAHCPCSNAAIGSGFFKMRSHLHHGVRFALGTDVGGGTGYGVLKEALQAYMLQRLAPDGVMMTAAQMLYLATKAGAEALCLEDEVGDFGMGKAFDAVWVKPRAGDPLLEVFRHSDSAERSLAAVFALAGSESIAEVWIGGDSVHARA